jgi:hypothetical protein
MNSNELRKKLSMPAAKGLVIEVLFEGQEIQNNVSFKNLTPNEIIGALEVLKQKLIETQMKTTTGKKDDDSFLHELR